MTSTATAGSMLGRVRRYGYPLSALVKRELRKRYAGSMLGAAWTVLQPLTLIAVYVVVFGFVLRAERATGSTLEYVLFLLCGMLPFLAISDGIQRASYSLKEDRTLLEREAFPAEVVPATRVLTASVGELVGLAIVVILGVATGVTTTSWVVLLPVLVVLRLMVTLAIGWIVSMLAVFITDLNEVLSLLLTGWLFLTPVFYAAEVVPGPLRWTLIVNPLHHVVASYRAVLIDGRAPVPEVLLMVVWAVLLTTAGLWFFRKAIDRGRDLL
jgi:lipopolysaccharide transport system permease protein